MALAMTTMAGFCGSSHAVLEGSHQLSGSSSRLSMPKTNRIAFAEPGLRVRAQQQTSAETETGRRAMLGLLAAGMASGSFVQTVLAESVPTLPTVPDKMRRKIIVAGIPGLISEKSDSQGLIRADVAKLPLINVEDHPNFPPEVQAFMDQILLADAILFSAPEYNYSVTRNKPQTLISYSFLNSICTQTFDYFFNDVPLPTYFHSMGFWWGRMQYHLRQIGVRPDLHFINTPEVFVSTTVDAQHPPKFDANGDLIDETVREDLRKLLISLRNFTLPLKYCNNADKDSGIRT
ncbi:UNVERIFIED_CONTAM: NADPH:quinone oxidoreductase [Sesamum latifolium]|uniref:NAD(P)H dehydrogenase (quinone) n=1 Tax=Sesamum latifolium TaxID=2727402 RepID=A0AAW2TQR9_9LAMI